MSEHELNITHPKTAYYQNAKGEVLIFLEDDSGKMKALSDKDVQKIMKWCAGHHIRVETALLPLYYGGFQ